MSRLRVLLALGCSAALLPLFSVGASAFQPSNDVIAQATPVAMGFSQELDTTPASTDSEDTALGETCSAPAGPAGRTDASVWYSFTATSDIGVLVDVSASNYSAGTYVGTGEPGSLTAEACGPHSVAFSARAGTTYWVVAFDDQSDAFGNGGLLRISFSEAPPPPTVQLSIDPVGTFDAERGALRVTGTMACAGAELVQVLGAVRELTGPAPTTGYFRRGATRACDGTAHSWAANVSGESARFDGGKATVAASTIACSPRQCTQGYTDQVVRFKAA